MLASLTVNPSTNKAYKSYDEFRIQLESLPHSIFHVGVGYYSPSGVQGHMTNVKIAPNDPTFFLHHSNLDRYYKYFQKSNPSLTYDGKVFIPPLQSSKYNNADASNIMPTFNIPVSVGLAFEAGSFCYVYAPYSKSLAAVPINTQFLQRRGVSSVSDSVVHNGTVELPAPLSPPVANSVSSMESILAPVPLPKPADDILNAPADLGTSTSASSIPERFLLDFGMDVKQIRLAESQSTAFMNQIHAKTDHVLSSLFQTSSVQATHAEMAAAVKIVVASL